MNKANDSVVRRLRTGLGLLLLTVVAGCLGYVDGGYVNEGYGGPVVVAEPDVVLFGGGYYGGGYERGRDVHAYSHRGVVSRAAAHPVSGGHDKRR